MADAILILGGSPDPDYLKCDGQGRRWYPPHGYSDLDNVNEFFSSGDQTNGVPPYNNHIDGAYNFGDFVLGYPLNPTLNANIRMRNILAEANPGEDDILQLIAVPENNFVKSINFRIVTDNAALAGMTVAIVGSWVEYNYTTKEATVTEATDFTAIVAANGVSTAIPMSTRGNYNVWCMESVAASGGGSTSVTLPVTGTADLDSGAVTGTATGTVTISGTGVGYVPEGFYVAPDDDPNIQRTLYLGLQITAAPTNPDVNLSTTIKDTYFVARCGCYESPAYIG